MMAKRLLLFLRLAASEPTTSSGAGGRRTSGWGRGSLGAGNKAPASDRCKGRPRKLIHSS